MHPAIAHILGTKKPGPPRFIWMTDEAGATVSWIGDDTTPPNSLSTSGWPAVTPNVISNWGANTGVAPLASATAFNGKKGMVFVGTGDGVFAVGGGSGTFTLLAGGPAPATYCCVAAVIVTSAAALNPEGLSYNNDSIVADNNFRWGLTVGLDSTGAIGGGAAGYYLCAYIYNGTFRAAYSYIGVALPPTGFIACMRYTAGAGANNLICSVNDVEGTAATVGNMDSATNSVLMGGEPSGFGDNDYLNGSIAEIDFKSNATRPSAAIAALRSWWGTS